MPTLDAVLDDVGRLSSEGELPVVVFDLDSTLFNTAGRHLAILNAFAEQEPHVRSVVDDLALTDFGWHVEGPLVQRGFDDQATLERLRTFWFDRFFDGDWVGHDRPAEGAVEYVNEAWRRGALIYYLTGRHVGGMDAGTAKALSNSGFPFWHGRTVLHLKPDFHLGDKPFKDQAMRAIKSHKGRVVATFENEPPNANLFLDNFPEAHHFLVGTVRHPDGEPGRPELIAIPDFVPRDDEG